MVASPIYDRWLTFDFFPILLFLISTKFPILEPFDINEPGLILAKGPILTFDSNPEWVQLNSTMSFVEKVKYVKTKVNNVERRTLKLEEKKKQKKKPKMKGLDNW